MSTLDKLGLAVRQRRLEMGISQAALARLSGLSRTTVNQLESGAVKDLSVTRAERLLGVVGLRLGVPDASGRSASLPRVRSSPLALAARTAGVSYARQMPVPELARALVDGVVSERWQPHVRALLDEAPVSLLAAVVDELHLDRGVPRAVVWGRMRSLAAQLACARELWA